MHDEVISIGCQFFSDEHKFHPFYSLAITRQRKKRECGRLTTVIDVNLMK